MKINYFISMVFHMYILSRGVHLKQNHSFNLKSCIDCIISCTALLRITGRLSVSLSISIECPQCSIKQVLRPLCQKCTTWRKKKPRKPTISKLTISLNITQEDFCRIHTALQPLPWFLSWPIFQYSGERRTQKSDSGQGRQVPLGVSATSGADEQWLFLV